MGKHKYSDECACKQCRDTWNKALFAAIDRGEKEEREQKDRGKDK